MNIIFMTRFRTINAIKIAKIGFEPVKLQIFVSESQIFVLI